MTTLRQDLPLRLLRAVTAVAAAVLMLLGALTLQNIAGHTDEPISTLTGVTASVADDADPVSAHVDENHGIGSMFCALLGLAAMIISATIALGFVTVTRRPLFTLARLLARIRSPQTPPRWPAVSLTVLSISRV
jgi:hypothetical protein